MSQTRPGSRRRRWDARARGAQRRFVLYMNVERAIELDKSEGGCPRELVWRRPDHEIRRLWQTGGAALRLCGQQRPADVAHEQIERLEGVLDQLAAADDWTRRLHTFWQRLRYESARRALTLLVRLGCVPHDLVRCVDAFTDPGERKAVEGKRRETRAYLPRLRRLATAYERLATRCDTYTRLKEHYGGTKFWQDRHIAAFLRDEAAMMGEFIRDADPRRHATFTMGNTYLMDMMRDIKTITGQYQDTLVAQFLNGVPGVRMTPDQLRKMRNRRVLREKEWQSPRYGGRASRIGMDVQTTLPTG